MNGGPRIIDLRPGDREPAAEAYQPAPIGPADDVLELDHPVPRENVILGHQELAAGFVDDEVERPVRPWGVFLLAFFLLTVAIGGTAGLTLLSARRLDPVGDPIGFAAFVAGVTGFLALLGVFWLLMQRTSRAEARRFGNTAAAMRAESAALEQAIATLGRAIDESRVRLADQTTTMLASGDAAATRLEEVSRAMAQQIADAQEEGRRLSEAAEGAQVRLGVLLASMPRALADTEQVAARLQDVGLTASQHAAALDAQVTALAERGREADAMASGAAQRLAAHMARMEATSETASARLEQVTGSMSDSVDGLLDRTARAVDEARKGIAAQGEAMLAMLSTNQAALDHAARDSAEALRARIAEIGALVDRMSARLDEQQVATNAVVHEIDGGVAAVETRLEALYSLGIDRTQTLAASISALGGSADAMTESLRAGDTVAGQVITTAEQLLTALDAAAREMDESMPEALTRLDQRITATRAGIGAAKPELLALVTAAESTHDAIEAIAQLVSHQRDTVTQLSGTLLEALTTGRAKADALGMMVDETVARAHQFADEAAPRLLDALLRVRETANQAAERARETLTGVIPDAARMLGEASAAAMERAAAQSVVTQVDELAKAAEHAVEAATQASVRLERQLAGIIDATALIETRLAERNTAERDSFARRASVLVDALNSAAIDVAKLYGSEVSDSAWGAYLKGDRGVFTRRAVRLLDLGEARTIADRYDADAAFRDAVNRYIHDFEAMLRGVLAQTDGSPLGVTLLSSDMGKLYVALAQAIERLRT